MIVFVVDIIRHRPQQVQLYLLCCWGEGEAGVVVGEERLVVLLVAGVCWRVPSHSVHDDRSPDTPAKVDGDTSPGGMFGKNE